MPYLKFASACATGNVAVRLELAEVSNNCVLRGGTDVLPRGALVVTLLTVTSSTVLKAAFRMFLSSSIIHFFFTVKLERQLTIEHRRRQQQQINAGNASASTLNCDIPTIIIFFNTSKGNESNPW
jgi:hypothetical protein